MSQFDDVIQQFQQKRIEKEIYAHKVKRERMDALQDLADLADMEMRKRRRRKSQRFQA